MNAPVYAHQMQREQSAAPFIPYMAHVSPNTLATRDGDLVRIYRVEGITYETTDADDIQIRMDNLNTLIRAIAGDQIAFWTHEARYNVSERLEAEFDNEFCKKLNDRYFDSFTGYRMMTTELYLSVVYRPTPSKMGRLFAKSGKRTHDEIMNERAENLRKFDGITMQVEKSLRAYDIEPLTAYEAEHVDRLGNRHKFQCSHALEFLEFLLTGVWKRVRIPKGPLNTYLGNAWVHVGTETIEIRTPERTRFAQAIDFKDYPMQTEPGFLNDLKYEDYPYVITQSFSCMSKRKGVDKLTQQANQLASTEDAAESQIAEMKVALNDLVAGSFCMGEYHFSIMVFGDTVREVRDNVAKCMAIIGDMGFIASIVTTATDAAFFAQLPANWSYRPRLAYLTSLNFAGLCSFHNFLRGKRDRNPWGQAVTLLKTPSGQPLYFNFHASKEDEDSLDKKLLANTRVIGQSGTGKTVLLGFLFSQAQKYLRQSPNGFTNVFYDKDRGAEIMIRAVGGKYLAIKNGQRTGFNPFQLDENEANIGFLNELVAVLVEGDTESEKLSASDLERINKAVRTVMRMPREIRRLALVPQNITEPADPRLRENSVKKRLARWCNEGPLAWVLDNPHDELDFTTHDTYGFDGTDFLDNKLVCTPITMYLLYRQKQNVDGRRFINWWDECWKWILNEHIAGAIADSQLTIRKQDGFNVFATQMPSSLLNSPIAAELTQQCATEIYLPNPKADYEEYTTGKGGNRGFGLTDAEFAHVKSFAEDSRKMLIKQGHRSAIAHLDLFGLDDELTVLSGSTDNIELLYEVMAETGDDPKAWMPVFLGRVHDRKKRDRLKSKAA
jgi:type IV secretion/conjugal transfer VirB4 family ATPase